MRDAYSQLIRKKTVDFLDSISVRYVHSYISFHSEVGTYGIIEDLLQRKIKVAVPIVGGEPGNESMHHSLIDDLDHLKPGKFGVPEPVSLKENFDLDFDAVLLPVVAFDGEGMRLGYGKGYYDRFLASISPKIMRIGLAFSVQEMDKIPIMSHDQLMNYIITEQSVFFSNRVYNLNFIIVYLHLNQHVLGILPEDFAPSAY